MKNRIFLSPPHLGDDELRFVLEAFESNYIAPLGPQVEQFEREFADYLDAAGAVAVSSGTAALHLALRYAGVETGDEVFCSALTFVASANAISYLGAKPVFIDSETASWNMDPHLLKRALAVKAAEGKIPKALVLVHLYGQSAQVDEIVALCEQYGVFLLEDAAESLGATYKGCATGAFGRAGIFSFNGNKIITTSGGGMVVAQEQDLLNKVKYWASQARDAAIHYEHTELGYNYRMSNVLAAIGRGQLRVLGDRIKRKREIFSTYQRILGDLPGLTFMPDPEWGRSTHWLSSMIIDPVTSGTDRDAIIAVLDQHNIEARPVWKPLHLQPLYRDCEVFGGDVSQALFENGICLPSGTAMGEDDLECICSLVRKCWA
ncbi:aminotransferase class I/II-fold pyridoxal phosphate-dependent enzyme [bacterium]|nr:aminotransferase class I/II-fold pyridoxal phosphate-dependent enzyme [bacterium]